MCCRKFKLLSLHLGFRNEEIFLLMKRQLSIYLSIFKRNYSGVVRCADDAVIASDFFQRAHPELVVTVTVSVCEVLPWLKSFSIVRRSLQYPGASTRRVGEFDQNIGDVENLKEIMELKPSTFLNLDTTTKSVFRGALCHAPLPPFLIDFQ